MVDRVGTLGSFCWVTAGAIAVFLCLLQMGAMISGLTGHGLFLVAPTALAVTMVLAWWLGRREGLAGRWLWGPVWLIPALVAVTVAISAYYYDLSWDGEWYHQTGIINIAGGWSPLKEPLRAFARHRELWVRHYAKGTWYGAAAIYAATGRMEWGKCIALMAPAAAFFAVMGACLSGGLRNSRAAAIAVLVAINPVAMSELTTFLVDGVMVSFLVATAAAIFTSLYRPSAVVALTAVAASIVCINAKFTGLVYLCFVFLVAGIWCLWQRRGSLLRSGGIAVTGLVLGTLAWGYNPYVTNTVLRRQPFYPQMGSANYPSIMQQGKDGNEKYETPHNMMGRSRLFRVAYATFGRPGNQPYEVGLNASLMWPFTARVADLYCYKYHEARIAGFGPYFSGGLLLSLALEIWLLFRTKGPLRWLLILTTVMIPATLLIGPHLWWPRYGPQLWLMPILPLAVAFREGASRRLAGLTWALVALLFVNAAIVGTVRMRWETWATRTLREQLRQMRDSGQEYEVSTRYFSDAAKLRLDWAGVRYTDIGMKKIPDGTELMSVVEKYPASMAYRVKGGNDGGKIQK